MLSKDISIAILSGAVGAFFGYLAFRESNKKSVKQSELAAVAAAMNVPPTWQTTVVKPPLPDTVCRMLEVALRTPLAAQNLQN